MKVVEKLQSTYWKYRTCKFLKSLKADDEIEIIELLNTVRSQSVFGGLPNTTYSSSVQRGITAGIMSMVFKDYCRLIYRAKGFNEDYESPLDIPEPWVDLPDMFVRRK